LPLNAFRDGRKPHQALGRLLVWQESGTFENTGHVVVVTEVSEHHIRITKQNFARELSTKITEDGQFCAKFSYGDTEILRWMTQTDDARYAKISPIKNAALIATRSSTPTLIPLPGSRG
jgi:glutathionylspermidine amidase/synthetase